jgi:hypothetical protein
MHTHTTKLLTAGNGKTVCLMITTSKQFHLERKLNKPLIFTRSALHLAFYRFAANSLERETNIRTLASTQTLITVYQMRPTSLAFIYNSKQGTLVGCHGNCSVSNLLVRQLMTFISNRLPSSAGNLSLLDYPAPIATKEWQSA